MPYPDPTPEMLVRQEAELQSCAERINWGGWIFVVSFSLLLFGFFRRKRQKC
jgi:hypothetical protein